MSTQAQTLLAVIAGSTRRKVDYWVSKALVSELYDQIYTESFIASPFIVVDGDRPDLPVDYFSISMLSVESGYIDEPLITKEDDAYFIANNLQAYSGELITEIDPIVNKVYSEAFYSNLLYPISGTLAVTKVSQRDGQTFNMNILSVTSGSLT